jgi:hypothetical protein
MNESLKLRGIWTIREYNEKGELLNTIVKENMVVDDGLNLVLSRLNSNSLDFIDYIAVGTGSTTASASDTALETELLRKQATDKSLTGNELSVQTSFGTAEAIGDWREAGVFTASSSGTMLNRVNLVYEKTTGIIVVVKFELKLERGS